MNIGIISSREHLSLARVMLTSLIENTSQKIELYLFHKDLNAEEMELIDIFGDKMSLHSVKVDSSLFDGIKVEGHFGIYSYFRLLAPYVLPEDMGRLLFLDTDLIICKDLSEYYNSDFEDKALIASPSNLSMTGGGLNEIIKKKYKVPDDYVYFNAGVLLLNLRHIRDKINLSQILDIAHSEKEYLKYIDQDILNVLFWNDRVLSSQYLYNFAPKDASKDSNINKKSIKTAYIIHYCGDKKPTEASYRDMGFNLYWKYAKKYAYTDYITVSLKHMIYVLGRKIKSIVKLRSC